MLCQNQGESVIVERNRLLSRAIVCFHLVSDNASGSQKAATQEPREVDKMAAQLVVLSPPGHWRARDAHARSGARAEIWFVVGHLMSRVVSSGSSLAC